MVRMREVSRGMSEHTHAPNQAHENYYDPPNRFADSSKILHSGVMSLYQVLGHASHSQAYGVIDRHAVLHRYFCMFLSEIHVFPIITLRTSDLRCVYGQSV